MLAVFSFTYLNAVHTFNNVQHLIHIFQQSFICNDCGSLVLYIQYKTSHKTSRHLLELGTSNWGLAIRVVVLLAICICSGHFLTIIKKHDVMSIQAIDHRLHLMADHKHSLSWNQHDEQNRHVWSNDIKGRGEASSFNISVKVCDNGTFNSTPVGRWHTKGHQTSRLFQPSQSELISCKAILVCHLCAQPGKRATLSFDCHGKGVIECYCWYSLYITSSQKWIFTCNVCVICSIAVTCRFVKATCCPNKQGRDLVVGT